MPYTDAQLLGAEQLLQLHADKCDAHDTIATVNKQQQPENTGASQLVTRPTRHSQILVTSWHLWRFYRDELNVRN